MTKAEQFLKVLKEKIGVELNPALVGTVVSIEGNTCTVKLLDADLTIEDVLLVANDDNKKGFIVTPVKNSNVHIMPIGDKNRMQVVCYSEIENVSVKVEDVQLYIDNKGCKIAKGDKDMKTLLTDLVSVIAGIVVIQGKGPDLPKLQNIITDINELLL